MELRPSRLRGGEVVASLAGVALAVLLAAVAWSAPAGGGGSLTGWETMPVARWLVALSCAAALLLGFAQATRRAPALPVSLSVIVTVLGAITTVALAVAIATDSGTPLTGAFVGLAVAVAMTVGGFWSLRQEDGWLPGPGHPIERISIGPPESS